MTDTPQSHVSPNTGRYSLADDGQIFFQPDATNPLPGAFFTKILPGETMLSPKAADAKAQEWLDIYVRSTLEPLFLLKGEGEGALIGVARVIGERLYDHLGVIHRSDLEDQITLLDPDLRKALRNKGIRLGPVLAFLPALVKPAAIKLRALLWGLWNGKTLPMARPVDGRVSEVIDPENVDRNFYRMIGYPIFGPRAIRIDMLDRVVTDIYDSAKEGVFDAQNKYAEWLGCNLDGLYAILESMGHRKLKEAVAPVEAVPADITAAEAANIITAAESAAEAPALEAIPAVTVSSDVAEVIATAKVPAPVVKFMLKRGKMSERPGGNRKPPARPERPARTERPERTKSENKAPFDPNKPHFKKDKKREEGNDRPKKSYDRDASRQGGGRDDRGRDAAPRKKGERDDNLGRVYTFEGKKAEGDDDGNPFAILKNLKK